MARPSDAAEPAKPATNGGAIERCGAENEVLAPQVRAAAAVSREELANQVKADWLLGHLARRPVLLEAGRQPQLLDFRCGTGRWLKTLRRRGFTGDLHGCDPSRSRLVETMRSWDAGKLPELVQDASERLPYDDDSIDIVTVAEVLHETPLDFRPRAFQEIARILAPTGRLYVFEYNPWSPATRRALKRKRVDAEALLVSHNEVRRRARSSGLAFTGIEHLLFFPPGWQWARKIERKLNWLPFGSQYVVWGEPLACLPKEMPGYRGDAEAPRFGFTGDWGS